MSRARVTLLVTGALVAVLAIVAWFLPVPYVILLPGPVTDTLGNVPSGLLAHGQTDGPVITVTGKPTTTSNGHLYLTTVDEEPGSCDDHPTLEQAVHAWFSRTQTVDPQQVACPPGQSAQQVRAQGEQQMTQSQSDAETAALFELGYRPTSIHLTVGTTVDPGTPAAQALAPGDVIDSVNGQTVTTAQALQSIIRSKPVGSQVTFVLLRDGRQLTETVRTINGGNGVPLVGFDVDRTATFPGVSVQIGIDPTSVGGPSAGTALALGIISKLTPGGLTGGRTIAGTGTVDGFGVVGPIGGIQQKIAAAVSNHATVFFAPASECADAKSAAPKSLTLIKVDTLHTAVTALAAIRAGTTNFPHC